MSDTPSSENVEYIAEAAEETVPWQCYVPGIVLLVPMVIAFALKFFSSDEGMVDWAVSRHGLFAGEFANLQLHMFAHGAIIHVLMNGIGLFYISAAVVQKFGGWSVGALVKFLLLFELAGLGGALAFLLIHQWNDMPMLGASESDSKLFIMIS